MNEIEVDISQLDDVDALCSLAGQTFEQVQAASICGDYEAHARFWHRYTQIIFYLSVTTPKTLGECGQICSFVTALINARVEGIDVGDGLDELRMLASCHGNYLHLLNRNNEGRSKQSGEMPTAAIGLQFHGSNDNSTAEPAS